MTTFKARLRKNLLRLWLLGAIVNATILVWIGAEKLPLAALLLIGLGLASLNAIVGVGIYALILRIRNQKTSRAIESPRR